MAYRPDGIGLTPDKRDATVLATRPKEPRMASTARQRLYLAAEAAVRKSTDPARRKCFISYHAADVDEVTGFVETFGAVFIPKVIGVQDSDPFVDSENTDYILDRIREKYLTDSTVTIVLVGKCTWARRYVDWEVYSSLRNDQNNRRNGLLAITLPSAANYSGKRLPDRVNDNDKRDSNDNSVGYARWKKYPTSSSSLRSWIEDAFDARSSRTHLIINTRSRKKYNSTCP
jgi:hypothetical protein